MQYFCDCCHKSASIDGLDTHHRKPQNVSGSDDPSNLVKICATCHSNTHKLVHKLRKGNMGAIYSFLEENYPGDFDVHKLMIDMAQTVVLEEENGEKTEVNVMYKPTVEVHKKLKDLAKQSKVSLVHLIDELIEAEYRRRNFSKPNGLNPLRAKRDQT